MIKLRKPIETRQKNILNKGYERFGQKIIANYEFMAMTMNPEDLLHMVSTPPEIYLVEEANNSFANTNVTWNNNETRLTLVNNMINRLMVDPKVELSYQDKIFIESILRKAGITNVTDFITRVRNMQTRISENRELVNYFMSQGDEFKTMLNMTKAEREQAARSTGRTENAEPAERLFLQDRIFERLQTTEIVEALEELYADRSAAGSVINNYEASMAEMKRMTDTITLRETEKLLFGSERLTDRIYINPYEVGDRVENEEAIHDQVVRELTSAVLLETIANLYQMRYSEIHEGQDNWYDYSSNMGVNLENNVQRYENFHNSQAQLVYQVKESRDEAPLYEDESGQNEELPPIQMNHYSTIEEMVEYYDRRNAEIYNQVRQINEQLPQPRELHVDRAKARQDALRALTDPDAVRREYEEEHTRLEHIRQTRETAYEKLMSQETKEVFNVLRAMQKGEPLPEGVAVHRGGGVEMLLNAQAEEIRRHNEAIPENIIANQLVRDHILHNEPAQITSQELTHRTDNRTDINEIRNETTGRELVNRQTEREQITNEILRNITDRQQETTIRTSRDEISEDLVHNTAFARDINENISKTIHENVREVIDRQRVNNVTLREPEIGYENAETADIIFKRDQTVLDEETLSEIISNRLETEKREEHTEREEVVNNYETVTREVNTNVNETVQNSVSSAFQTQLRSEMANISDQVYRQIEQRLSLERRRRGY